MKRLLLVTFLFCAASLSAQTTRTEERIRDVRSNPDYFFLKITDVASSLRLLPEPPQPGDLRFQLDQARYYWGKLQRGTERGELAVRDAKIDPDGVCVAMADAFGFHISKDESPELYVLVTKINGDAGDLCTREAKNYYMRQRPYMLMEEPSAVPGDEEVLRHNGSYPSGHTAIGWATALVLSEINVENQQEILERGYDMGTSRVIAGYHWQSDVDNARIVAAALVARLHADEGFQQQLAKAKSEFARLKAAGKIKIHGFDPTMN